MAARGTFWNISAELEGAVIFSKNAKYLILCQEVLARIVATWDSRQLLPLVLFWFKTNDRVGMEFPLSQITNCFVLRC